MPCFLLLSLLPFVTHRLLPMYYTPDGFLGHATQYSTVQRSSDGGKSWTEYVMAGTMGRCVQPTVVRLRSGILRAWFRCDVTSLRLG
jgi:hypothetical protein